MKLKTSKEVKADFEKNGISIRSWAEANGFRRTDVYAVLDGRVKAKYGNGHVIAVALGMKEGATGMTAATYRPVSAFTVKARGVPA